MTIQILIELFILFTIFFTCNFIFTCSQDEFCTENIGASVAFAAVNFVAFFLFGIFLHYYKGI